GQRVEPVVLVVARGRPPLGRRGRGRGLRAADAERRRGAEPGEERASEHGALSHAPAPRSPERLAADKRAHARLSYARFRALTQTFVAPDKEFRGFISVSAAKRRLRSSQTGHDLCYSRA